jgi:two-component system chemotaxis sensor kinase CheA
MRALLDSLDQGFFIFDRTGKCLNIYTRSCLNLLGRAPSDSTFWEAIKAESQDVNMIKKWITNIFSDALPFDDLVPLGPEKVNDSDQRSIALNYYPMNNANGELESVVVVATDRTAIEQAEETAEREKAYSRMVLNVIRRKKELTRFIFDTQKLLIELAGATSNHYKFQMQTALRCLHTIKGGASTFAIYDLAQSCHEAEQLLMEIQSDGLAKDSLAILHDHFNRVRYEFQTFLKTNEMLLGNDVLLGQRSVEIPLKILSGFLDKIKSEPSLSEEVKEFEKDVFFVPIRQFIEGFEEATQALALKLGKKLKPMIIEGGDTLIHREHYSELFTTLIHQLNNIVDHGIENPILRRFHHKEESGQISIRVSLENSSSFISRSNLVIQIADDGQGLDSRKIRERLSQKGIPTDRLTDDEVLQFIFKGNLSSKANVTEISGRGIGMEAIMHKVLDLGGSARIESVLLKGTSLTIKVPYMTEQEQLSA